VQAGVVEQLKQTVAESRESAARAEQAEQVEQAQKEASHAR